MPSNRFSNIFGLSYTSTIPFEDKTFDSDDLARLRYFPLDSDGKFSDVDFRVLRLDNVNHWFSEGVVEVYVTLREIFDVLLICRFILIELLLIFIDLLLSNGGL